MSNPKVCLLTGQQDFPVVYWESRNFCSWGRIWRRSTAFIRAEPWWRCSGPSSKTLQTNLPVCNYHVFQKRKVVWNVPIYHLKSTNINFSLITLVNILYFNLCLLVPSNKRMPALISIWNKCIYFNMDQSHMSDIWFRQSVIRLKRRLSYLIRLAEWIFIIYCRAHITLLLVHFCWFSNLNFILNTNLCTYNSRAGFTFFLFCNTIADFI